MGLEIHRGSYRLAKKNLKQWMGTHLPGSLQELQQVLGRLLWASPFIPDFKAKVRPIEALLSPSSEGVWTERCTEALNGLLRDIERRLTLAIAEPETPLDVFVSLGPEAGMAVLT